MDRRLKIPSPWAQLGLFMLLLGGFLVFISVILTYASGGAVGDKWSQALATIGIFGLSAFLFAYMTTWEKPMEFLGFRKASDPVFYGLTVILLLISFPFEGWLGQINKSLPLPEWMITAEKGADAQIAQFLKADSPLGIVINVGLIALLPAIFEEVCFRGALQRVLIQAFKHPWGGIIVTGIFFSAFHFQFQGFLPRTFLGILLGAAYWYSGSLWPAILGHFVVNGAQVVAVSYYPRMLKEDPVVPIYWAIISLVLVVGLLLLMHRRSTASYAVVYANDDKEYDEFAK
jgi:membrane protease YdiL (CAAX protease family)